MPRPFRTFVGIDLGGARGKTTALARLTVSPRGLDDGVLVEEVSTRHANATPWYDDVLLDYLGGLDNQTVVAIGAPLTFPACMRCTVAVCPGQAACEVPSVVWLNTRGVELVQAAAAEDRDRIAAIPARGAASAQPAPATPTRPTARPVLTPYTHRCTGIYLRYERNIATRETLGEGSGPLTARAVHLRRALARHGYALNHNLIEVSPRATVHALFGGRLARGYKRNADPWETRAEIVERLDSSLRFAARSAFSREQVLRNDHCFDAVLAGYTAFLWARDDWRLPPGDERLFDDDGWVWVPGTWR
jgi:hypothetical protein